VGDALREQEIRNVLEIGGWRLEIGKIEIPLGPIRKWSRSHI
jgi:hypothetical protein